MSSRPAYLDKTDSEIIHEQAASLDAKTDWRNKKKFDTGRTEYSDTSGVNETGLDEFEGVDVHVERGYRGGGENMRIPPEHGGDPRTEGSRPSFYEDVPPGEDKQSWTMKTQPGSINVSNDRQEALRTLDAPDSPQLDEQWIRPPHDRT